MVDVTATIRSAVTGGMGEMLTEILFWSKWVIIALIIGAVLAGFYFFLQYKYKVIVFERGGSGELDGEKSHYIRKVSLWERAKPVRDKTGINHWKLLFARRKIEPIDLKNVYPGNTVFLYKVSEDTYVPVNFSSGNPESLFNPVPQTVRRWMTLEIQQAAQDYQKRTNWEMYAPLAVMGGTILFCCILTGVVIYIAFSNVNALVPSLENVARGLSNVNVIPGAPQ